MTCDDGAVREVFLSHASYNTAVNVMRDGDGHARMRVADMFPLSLPRGDAPSVGRASAVKSTAFSRRTVEVRLQKRLGNPYREPLYYYILYRRTPSKRPRRPPPAVHLAASAHAAAAA